MVEGVVAVFIPIVFFIITGAVIVSMLFFRNREKQLMLEKGFSAEEMKEMYKSREGNSTILLKVGIIITMFGIFLGIGFALESMFNSEVFIPVSIFVGLGLGFITSYFVSLKYDKQTVENEKGQ